MERNNIYNPIYAVDYYFQPRELALINKNRELFKNISEEFEELDFSLIFKSFIVLGLKKYKSKYNKLLYLALYEKLLNHELIVPTKDDVNYLYAKITVEKSLISLFEDCEDGSLIENSLEILEDLYNNSNKEKYDISAKEEREQIDNAINLLIYNNELDEDSSEFDIEQNNNESESNDIDLYSFIDFIKDYFSSNKRFSSRDLVFKLSNIEERFLAIQDTLLEDIKQLAEKTDDVLVVRTTPVVSEKKDEDYCEMYR